MTIKQLVEIVDGRLMPSANKLDGDLLEIATNPNNGLEAVEGGLLVDVSAFQTADQVINTVNLAVSSIVDGAPSTFDTLKEISDWINGDGVNATELASNLATKANTVHTHVISDVTGLQAAIDGKLGSASNAVSATKLATARTVGGVSFDGTASINLPGVNTAGNQNTTGNSATATKLATIRKINTIDFDGTADITIADATKLPLSGGTISGNVVVTGTTTLNTALPLTSGGTGVTSLAALKTSLGVPQFIQITLANYNLLTEGEKTDTTKLYLIVG